jgi:uncharacterized membrane protein
MFEGMWVSLKEGIEGALVAVLVVSYLSQNNRAWLKKYFYFGLVSGILAAPIFTSFFPGPEMLLKNQLIRFFVLLDGLVFFATLLAFIRLIGIDLFATPYRILARFRFLQGVLTWLGSSLLVFFNGLGVFLSLKALAVIKGNSVQVFAAGLFGIITAIGIAVLLVRFAERVKLGRLFTSASLLLSIFTIKLLGGGVKDYSEVAVIPYMLKRLIKMGHDIVHIVIIGFLFPDHPFLKTQFWNFIGLFFNDKVILSLVFIALGGPTMYLAWKVITKPLPALVGETKGAERRKKLAGFVKVRRLQFIVVAAAFFIIVSFIFAAGVSPVDQVYNPEPQPALDDGKGVISIPLTGPANDIADGRLHKWSYRTEDKTIVFLAIKRPDGVVAVALDICEICQPDGYSQVGDKYVLCKYCKTPIPISTVGQPGGCNPVPLKADAAGQNLQIGVKDLVSEYDRVMRAKQ